MSVTCNPQRVYTVDELDALRHAVENHWLFGSYRLPDGGGCSRSYREEEKSVAVEQRVRTHMCAGHTASDLYENEDRKKEDFELFIRRWNDEVVVQEIIAKNIAEARP